ncbi:hypothetical protein B0H12DRAFT_316943 [Mycena haematopus]|nr:hypothetical protein B0H12DRAFT_316943 [Mycena haematopus]
MGSGVQILQRERIVGLGFRCGFRHHRQSGLERLSQNDPLAGGKPQGRIWSHGRRGGWLDSELLRSDEIEGIWIHMGMEEVWTLTMSHLSRASRAPGPILEAHGCPHPLSPPGDPAIRHPRSGGRPTYGRRRRVHLQMQQQHLPRGNRQLDCLGTPSSGLGGRSSSQRRQLDSQPRGVAILPCRPYDKVQSKTQVGA